MTGPTHTARASRPKVKPVHPVFDYRGGFYHLGSTLLGERDVADIFHGGLPRQVADYRNRLLREGYTEVQIATAGISLPSAPNPDYVRRYPRHLQGFASAPSRPVPSPTDPPSDSADPRPSPTNTIFADPERGPIVRLSDSPAAVAGAPHAMVPRRPRSSSSRPSAETVAELVPEPTSSYLSGWWPALATFLAAAGLVGFGVTGGAAGLLVPALAPVVGGLVDQAGTELGRRAGDAPIAVSGPGEVVQSVSERRSIGRDISRLMPGPSFAQEGDRNATLLPADGERVQGESLDVQ